MNPDQYLVKTADRTGVDIAIKWAAGEGWNPGMNDGDCYLAADNKGFLVGYLGTEAIATISAINYGDFGFLGFYIVKPEYRGQGYGLKIWNAALQYLQGCNIGLDGVVEQQDNYRKSGFQLAFRNVRFQGKGGAEGPDNKGMVSLSEVSFRDVTDYDRPFFPAQRSGFLHQWINQREGISLGVRKSGELAGYGVLRPCRSGYKIGPLYADNPELADTLFRALISRLRPDEPVFLDVPEVNLEAMALAKRFDMSIVFETARMYTGPAPALPMDRIFGITSFEIG